MLEIVKSSTDPMTALERLVQQAKVMVENLPKPPQV